MFDRKKYLQEYHKKYQPEWYKKNKEKHYQKRIERKKRLKQWLYDKKKNLFCEKCGYNNHPAALEFHHKNDDKENSIGQMISNVTGKEKIEKEIAKCSVLCSNCHQILHYELYHQKSNFIE